MAKSKFKAAEWDACNDAVSMIAQLPGQMKRAKRRWLALACAWRFRNQLPSPRFQPLLEIAERYALGQATKAEMTDACSTARALKDDLINERGTVPYHAQVISGALSNLLAEVINAHWLRSPFCKDADIENRVFCRLLREVVGNPFRLVRFDPAWLAWKNGTVPRMAQLAHERNCFTELPILADALEEAGCDNAEVLNHCRHGGEHVRGCWVIDLILDR